MSPGREDRKSLSDEEGGVYGIKLENVVSINAQIVVFKCAWTWYAC